MEHGWAVHVDPSSGKRYYHNDRTNETTWTRPAALDDPPRPAVAQRGAAVVANGHHKPPSPSRLLRQAQRSLDACLPVISGAEYTPEGARTADQLLRAATARPAPLLPLLPPLLPAPRVSFPPNLCGSAPSV